MPMMENLPPTITPATSDPVASRATARVLLAGLGNIGSFLAVLLAPLVAFIRLVDRDTVELHNTVNQFYGPHQEGQNKVDVTADRIARLAPHLEIERRVADLEDLPWGDFADVDIGLAGLDSLRARQLLAEKFYPLRIPYIDGAVGDPLLVRTQVMLPGEACLECSWGAAHYRQLTTEYPCLPGASAKAARTTAPGCAGAATAALMVAQFMKLLGAQPPLQSYEINGDLAAGRFVTSRRRRNERCRFQHETPPRRIQLHRPFAEATVADILATVAAEYGPEPVQLEFRRGLLEDGLFRSGRVASPDQLRPIGGRRLEEFGLTPRDRVVIRTNAQTQQAHVCFDSTPRSVS